MGVALVHTFPDVNTRRALLQQLTLVKRVNQVPTRYMTMFTWPQQWSLASYSAWSFHLHPGLSTALFPSRTSTKITYGVLTVSSVSIVTRLRAGRPRNCNSKPGRSNRFSSFANRQDRSLVLCHCIAFPAGLHTAQLFLRSLYFLS